VAAIVMERNQIFLHFLGERNVDAGHVAQMAIAGMSIEGALKTAPPRNEALNR
jgi:hypothetical protein